jgi:hypothetical protein
MQISDAASLAVRIASFFLASFFQKKLGGFSAFLLVVGA